MSNRSHLIPTPVVTKNGVSTTVHKKPVGSPQPVGTIPAPAVTTATTKLSVKDRKEIKATITKAIGWFSVEWNDQWSYENLDVTLDSYPDSTIAAIRDYLPTISTSFAGEEERGDFLYALVNEKRRENGVTVHEYISYRSCFSRSTSVGTMMNYVRSLHTYTQLPMMDNYAEGDEDTRAQVKAIMTVTNSLVGRYWQDAFLSAGGNQPASVAPLPISSGSEIKITDDSIVNLLVERPDLADEITDIILNKKVRDGVLIREMIESEAQSIRDGML